MHHSLAKTDISKTAIRKSKRNVSKIINITKSVSNPFKFDVNKQDEDRASLVNIADGAVSPCVNYMQYLPVRGCSIREDMHYP